VHAQRGQWWESKWRTDKDDLGLESHGIAWSDSEELEEDGEDVE
jgi:hypothetical protein